MFDEQNQQNNDYHPDGSWIPDQPPKQSQQSQSDYGYRPNDEWEQRHRPMHSTQPEGGGFITAALVMGILSLISLFSGLAPVFGALGILFAILSRRGQGSLPKQVHVGMGLSITGFTVGILIWIGLGIMVGNLLQDPSYREEFLRQYRSYYNGSDAYGDGNSGFFSGGDEDGSKSYGDTPDDSEDSYPDGSNGHDAYDDDYGDYYDDYFGDYYGDYFDDYFDDNGGNFYTDPGSGYEDGYDNGGSFNPFGYTPKSGASQNTPNTMNYGGWT